MGQDVLRGDSYCSVVRTEREAFKGFSVNGVSSEEHVRLRRRHGEADLDVFEIAVKAAQIDAFTVLLLRGPQPVVLIMVEQLDLHRNRSIYL